LELAIGSRNWIFNYLTPRIMMSQKERLQKAIQQTEKKIERIKLSLQDDFIIRFEGAGDKEAGMKSLVEKISNLQAKKEKYLARIEAL
jgi:hypothetical protein